MRYSGQVAVLLMANELFEVTFTLTQCVKMPRSTRRLRDDDNIVVVVVGVV